MDALEIILNPLVIILIAFAILIVAVALLDRGKQLKCPKCGQVFKAPLMDDKFVVGVTLPYLGQVKCPRCGTARSRGEYKKVKKTSTSAELQPIEPSRNLVCCKKLLLVLSPQPTSNASPTLNQKQLFLLKVFIDEVAGPTPLLLLI